MAEGSGIVPDLPCFFLETFVNRNPVQSGDVAEWFKAALLKSVVLERAP